MSKDSNWTEVRGGRPPLRQLAGRRAEARALHYLESRGLEFAERNFRSRFGEIDLVMRDRGCIVFVEVRLRRRSRFATAIESVDAGKRERLIRTARLYLGRRGIGDEISCRFDVIGIDIEADGHFTIDWRQDAFRSG